MATSIHQPHDKFFKNSMADIQVARDFFIAHLPPEIVQQIHINTLKLEKNTFIDAAYQAGEVDLIYSVQQGSNTAFLHLHCEHQSAVENNAAFRILSYKIKLMEAHKKQYPSTPYPIIYSMIVYTGEKLWNAPLEIFDLMNEPKELARKTLFQPYHLIDVQRIPDQELQKQLWSGLLEFTLKYRKTQDFVKFLRVLLPWLDEIDQGPSNFSKIVLRYVLDGIDKSSKDVFIYEVEKHLKPELKGETMTLAEQFRQEGFEKGVQQGKTLAEQFRQEGFEKGVQQGKTLAEQFRQEGFEKGVQQGKTLAEQFRQEGFEKGVQQGKTLAEQFRQEGREQGIHQGIHAGEVAILTRLLKLRFHEISAIHQKVIQEADTETLLQWSERVLTAIHIDEIFA